MCPALLTFSSAALLNSRPARTRHYSYTTVRPAPNTYTKRCRRRKNAPAALFGRNGFNSNNNTREEAVGYSLSGRASHPFAGLKKNVRDLAAPGAYAIRDEYGVLQYVGYAKDVGKRLEMHLNMDMTTDVRMEDYSFQTYIPRVDKKDVTAELLEGILEYWVSENGGMPPGNTVDRHIWEAFSKTTTTTRESTQRQSSSSPGTYAANNRNNSDQPEVKIPVRERRTPRRRATRTDADDGWQQPVGAGVKNNNTYQYGGAGGREDDYVEMNVDPLDPFTASSHRRTTRDGIWDPTGGAEDGEDWIPIFGVVGVASIVWLFSVLGGVVSTGAPSLGM